MPLSCPGREIVLAIASSALASLAAAQQPPEPGQTAAPAALPVDRVPARLAECAEVRSAPDRAAPVLAVLEPGTEVLASAAAVRGFRRVSTSYGWAGYVVEGAIAAPDAEAPRTSPDHLVEVAGCPDLALRGDTSDGSYRVLLGIGSNDDWHVTFDAVLQLFVSRSSKWKPEVHLLWVPETGETFVVDPRTKGTVRTWTLGLEAGLAFAGRVEPWVAAGFHRFQVTATAASGGAWVDSSPTVITPALAAGVRIPIVWRLVAGLDVRYAVPRDVRLDAFDRSTRVGGTSFAATIEVSLDGPAPESGAPRAAGPAGGPASAGSTPTRYGPPPVAFTFVRAIVTARSEVRTAPHPSAPVLFAVEAASVVDASDAPVGGFRRIRTADGRGGYVADGSVRIELSRPQ